MEKIIQSLINNWMRGADTYTHNGSTWLIFTDSKKWVIELTKEKTLWYNYNFFKQIFDLTSLNVVDNQHHITKWVEDNVINKVGDIHFRDARDRKLQFEDTIQNGVKETITSENRSWLTAENIIQNGKLVSETFVGGIEQIGNVNTVLNCGIKETKTPGKDGDIMSTIEWMEENKSTSYTKMINDVIDNGIKQTKHANKYNSIGPIIKEGKINDIIENGVRVSGTFVGGTRQKENVESVIGYGTKNPTG